MSKGFNQLGCLNLAKDILESVFYDWTNRNKDRIFKGMSTEGHSKECVDIAFLDSNFVEVLIDCTNSLEKGKLLKRFDEIIKNKLIN